MALSSVSAGTQVPSDGLEAFIDVTVVPMDSPRTLSRQTVLVQHGRILQVGPSSLVHIPTGTIRIEGRGLFLIPGLADMHVHLMEPEAYFPLFLKYGVTTVRNMAGGAEMLQLRDRVNNGSLTGPNVYTAGPLLDGAPPIWEGSDVATTPEQAVQAVVKQKAAGYDFLKVYDNLKPEAYEAIVAKASALQMRVAGHVPPHVGLQRVLRAHQWSIEHLTGYFEWLQDDHSPFRHEDNREVYPHPAHLLANRQALVDWVNQARIPEISELTAKAGTWNVPTLVAYLNMTPKSDLSAAWKRPGMQYATAMLRDWWNSENGFTAENWAAKRRGDAVRAKIFKALHNAGARLLVGTDTPHPFVLPGLSVHDEMVNFVSLGMSPYEALKASTADAAEFMGKTGEFGVIKPSARADLVLLEGNPLADIKNTSRIAGVMVRGQWLTRKMLDHSAAARR